MNALKVRFNHKPDIRDCVIVNNTRVLNRNLMLSYLPMAEDFLEENATCVIAIPALVEKIAELDFESCVEESAFLLALGTLMYHKNRGYQRRILKSLFNKEFLKSASGEHMSEAMERVSNEWNLRMSLMYKGDTNLQSCISLIVAAGVMIAWKNLLEEDEETMNLIIAILEDEFKDDTGSIEDFLK